MKPLSPDEKSLYIMANKDVREANLEAAEHFSKYGKHEFRNTYKSDFIFIKKFKAAKILTMQFNYDVKLSPLYSFLKFMIVPKLTMGINNNHGSFLSLHLPDISNIHSKNVVLINHRSELGNCLVNVDNIYLKNVVLGEECIYVMPKDSKNRFYMDELNQKLIIESYQNEK